MNFQNIIDLVINGLAEVDGNHMPTFYVQTDRQLIALIVAYTPDGEGTFRGLIASAALRMATEPEYKDQAIQAILYASTIRTSSADKQIPQAQEFADVDALVIEHQELGPGQPRRRRFWLIQRDAAGHYAGLRGVSEVRGVALDDNPLTIFLMTYAIFHRKVD